MRPLFNGGEFFIEIELKDKIVVLPSDFRISASNVSVWNDRFGVPEEVSPSQVKVDFA
jgi:hypothetical protein